MVLRCPIFGATQANSLRFSDEDVFDDPSRGMSVADDDAGSKYGEAGKTDITHGVFLHTHYSRILHNVAKCLRAPHFPTELRRRLHPAQDASQGPLQDNDIPKTFP
jgi:hypothetical protein